MSVALAHLSGSNVHFIWIGLNCWHLHEMHLQRNTSKLLQNDFQPLHHCISPSLHELFLPPVFPLFSFLAARSTSSTSIFPSSSCTSFPSAVTSSSSSKCSLHLFIASSSDVSSKCVRLSPSPYSSPLNRISSTCPWHPSFYSPSFIYSSFFAFLSNFCLLGIIVV